MKHFLIALASLMVVACESYDTAQVQDIPDDVKQSIQAAVNNGHRPAVVVGLINPQGVHFYAYGKTHADGATPISTESQFAISSLTKLFTAQTLEETVASGAVALDTQLTDIWPGLVDNANTQLVHLAHHTAALPRNISSDVLVSNSTEGLLQALSRSAQLPTEREYSSVGMAILGQSLAQSTQTDFAELLNESVADALRLEHTSYTPNLELLVGFHAGMTPLETPAATPSVAYGAGGLYSTAADLARFLQHQMSQQRSLGWHRHDSNGYTAFYHGGEGGGHQTFMAYRPDNQVGVVLLTNASADDALQDIALHLIDPRLELPSFEHPPYQRLSDADLAAFEGTYILAEDSANNTIILTSQEGRLMYHERTPEGEPVRRSPLFAIDTHRFELQDVPVAIVFDEESPDANALLIFGDQELTLTRTKD